MTAYHSIQEIGLEIVALAKSNRQARLQLVLAALAIGAIVMYGGAAVVRALFPRAAATYAVHGTVTYLGSPVEAGEIVFEPPLNDGQTRSTTIHDGIFVLRAKEGLVRGKKYVVRVRGYRKTGKKYENADMSLSAEISEQYLPSRYNSDSELSLETTRQNLNSDLTLQLH